MSDGDGDGDGDGHNPGVTPELCKAYRAVLEEKVNGLRNQIIGAISLSTAIIVLWLWVLKPV